MQRMIYQIFTSSGTFVAPAGVDKVIVEYYYNSSLLNLGSPAGSAQITLATAQAAALNTTDGSAWCWGDDSDGQLGNNATISTSSPVSVVGNISFSKLAAGDAVNLGIRGSDGSVWAWGLDGNSMLGQGAGFITLSVSSPISVIGANSYTKVSAGTSISLAIRGNDGSAWAWGLDTSGELGNNSITSVSSPVSVLGGISYSSVSGGISHVLGINGADGSAWAWGLGTSGELGNNTILSKSSPISVLGANSYIEVSSGNGRSAGLRGSDGSAWCWGTGGSGPNGDNTVANRSSPVSVVGNNSFIHIARRGATAAAIRGSDGSAWCWGLGTSGELGNLTLTNVSSPISVLGANSYVKISGGDFVCTAIRGSDGSVWAWGSDVAGKLGHNTVASQSSPVSVVGGRSYSAVSTGAAHSAAINGADGSAWTWGTGTSGQLGNNGIISQSSPVSVVGNHSFIDIQTGDAHTIAVKANGSVWVWGNAASGQLGNFQTAVNSSSPISVVEPTSFIQISASAHVMTIRGSDGTAWGWGLGTSGELGQLNLASKNSPTSVLGNISWFAIGAGGAYSAGIRASDGSAWAWGLNTSGQLGDNTITGKSSPVSVVGANSYIQISTGNTHTEAIRGSDGSAWAWGNSQSGKLGDNTTVNKSSPVSVVGANSYVQISAGTNHSAAIRGSDGSAWCWGLNTNGQLGQNTTNTRNSPVSVVGNHSFVYIAAGQSVTYATKSDGTLWSWGIGSGGLLGDNTGIDKSSPVMVAPMGSSEGASTFGTARTALVSVTPGTSYPVNFSGPDVFSFNGSNGFGTSMAISWVE